jgi:hypothetical protein
MSRSGLVIAYRGAGNLRNEFWPDIERKIFKNKQRLGIVGISNGQPVFRFGTDTVLDPLFSPQKNPILLTRI